MSLIIVLHAPLSGHAPAGWEQALLGMLPYGKRLAIERRDPLGRHASLAAIELALECVARLRGAPASARELRFPAGGKPVLPGGPFFSVSHTGGRVACAASATVDCGLDIEALDAPQAHDGPEVRRLRRWTAIEAVLKSAGLGLRSAGSVALADDLRSAAVREQRFWLRELRLAPDVIAHVAAREPFAEVKVAELPAGRVAPAP